MYRMTYVFEESDTQYYYNIIILYITRAVIVISLLGYCIAAVYILPSRVIVVVNKQFTIIFLSAVPIYIIIIMHSTYFNKTRNGVTHKFVTLSQA